MGHPRKIPKDKIQRLDSIEKKYGIDEMNLYAYMPTENEVIVNGEIFGDNLKNSISIMCSVYDKDGDIIASEKNDSYGSGLVTSNIKPEAFKGIFPFRISVDIPSGHKVGKIRVFPRA